MQQATLSGQSSSDDAKAPLPPLAIGARFYPEVATRVAGSATPNLVLESSHTDVIEVVDGALVARRAGSAAVLISTDTGLVVDYVHMWAAPVSSIALARRDGERIVGSIGLVVGEDLTIAASLLNGGQRLAGRADVSWTVDNPEVLAVLRDGTPERRRLRARAGGTAKVTVALGGTSTTLDVEVQP